MILGLSVTAAISLVALSLTVPVSAQTKKPVTKPAAKPTPSTTKPPPTTKSGKGQAQPAAKVDPPGTVIPGLPANVPATVREGLAKQFQQPLDERAARRKEAAQDAVVWLKRAETEEDSETRTRALVIAGARQVAALKLTEAVQTFQRAIKSAPGVPIIPGPAGVQKTAIPQTSPPEEVSPGSAAALWSIEARLFLFDLALEHELNVTLAEKTLFPVFAWARGIPLPATRTLARPPVGVVVSQPLTASLALQSVGPNLFAPPTGPVGSVAGGAVAEQTPNGAASHSAAPSDDSRTAAADDGPSLRTVSLIAADVRLRIGLLQVFANMGTAEFFAAEQLAFDRTTPLGAYASRAIAGVAPIRLPDPVRNGLADAAKLIRWGLVLDQSGGIERALRLFDALLKQAPEQISDPQRSFVHFHRGQARFRLTNPLQRDTKLIVQDYEQAVKLYPQSDWSDDALFLHGNLEWNVNQQADRAIALWTQLLEQHPGSAQGPRAAYFIGVARENSKQWDRAKLAYDDSKRRFPNSEFNQLIDQHLKKVNNELSRPKPKK